MIKEEIEWNGKIYYRYPESELRTDRMYYKRVCNYLHRDVWEYYNGPIPKGFHIHHIDKDTSNNNIKNLMLVDTKTHGSKHKFSKERLEKHKIHLSNIRHLTKAWHGSKEGLKKHRDIGAMAYKNFKPKIKKCRTCQEKFWPNQLGNLDLYCSNACKSKWRRIKGLDDIEKKCQFCSKTFKSNKYAKKLFCSKSCSKKHMWKQKMKK